MSTPSTPSYSDRQRLSFLVGWQGWTAEIRQSIDHAIETHRAKAGEQDRCLDCKTPFVPCDCSPGCTGGKCAVCR
jgi:hypothetical protein